MMKGDWASLNLVYPFSFVDFGVGSKLMVRQENSLNLHYIQDR